MRRSFYDEIEPRWKETCPFKTEIEEYVTRRDFLRFLLVVSSGFVFGNFFIFLKTLESKNELFHELDFRTGQ